MQFHVSLQSKRERFLHRDLEKKGEWCDKGRENCGRKQEQAKECWLLPAAERDGLDCPLDPGCGENNPKNTSTDTVKNILRGQWCSMMSEDTYL